MLDEQKKTLEILLTAIQMELDGKEFYLKASQESGNELGRELLKNLAAEEDIHRLKFKQIYDTIKNRRHWPATGFKTDGGRKLRTIFAEATEKIGSDIKPASTELEAATTAIGMEAKTYDFYREHLDKASYDAEKEFYRELAAQEREHQLILLDYYEFLKDPAGWFVEKEHPSLDAG